MRHIALALAVCFAFAPLQAGTQKSHFAKNQVVKARKNKVKGRKAPKGKSHARGVN